MNLKPIRKFHKLLLKTTGIIKDNPVLSLGMALPFAVIASTTLKSGVLMSIVMFIAIVPSVVVCSLTDKYIPGWLKLPLGCGISLACITAFIWYIRPEHPVIVQELGVYIPLAAFNMILLESISSENTPVSTIGLAARMCIGFALVMCSLSAVRELMVYRTIWDIEIPFAKLSISGAGLPCFGFILLGFFAAFFKWLGRLYIQIVYSRVREPDKRREEAA